MKYRLLILAIDILWIAGLALVGWSIWILSLPAALAYTGVVLAATAFALRRGLNSVANSGNRANREV